MTDGDTRTIANTPVQAVKRGPLESLNVLLSVAQRPDSRMNGDFNPHPSRIFRTLRKCCSTIFKKHDESGRVQVF